MCINEKSFCLRSPRSFAKDLYIDKEKCEGPLGGG
jgi:hypothetical protein